MLEGLVRCPCVLSHEERCDDRHTPIDAEPAEGGLLRLQGYRPWAIVQLSGSGLDAKGDLLLDAKGDLLLDAKGDLLPLARECVGDGDYTDAMGKRHGTAAHSGSAPALGHLSAGQL